ncbi:DUF881 domain-containing protein [Granulicoccus phenolivorans]|uniref:DUF881 domain-containing protein n=1 Tax=Granulicoccus phenolivorans TaxID=266854 RepID=UPI0004112F3A|nr:DUF881 domain-containing protein [Granulicoccus phenolivorans]
MREARDFQRRRSSGRARIATILTMVVIGVMLSASALHARGTDLRPTRNTSLAGLVEDKSASNRELARRVSALRAEVDALGVPSQTDGGQARTELARVAAAAGTEPVHGPAVTVVLSDAPTSVRAPDIDQDLLVVHQQDIQAVANAMWQAGAEAMTIQGQRVLATTGIKCVGNSVVLHGIPYAPPYEITAIGDTGRIRQSLQDSAHLRAYRQFADAYHLGYEVNTQADAELPGYQGALTLKYANPG